MPISRGAVRTFLVDSHDIFRLGMKVVLNDASGVDVVGEAATIRRAVDSGRLADADVVAVGLGAREDAVAAELPYLRRLHPQLPQIVLTRRPQEHAALLRTCAAIVLPKTLEVEQLIACVVETGRGRRVTQRSLASIRPRQEPTPEISPVSGAERLSDLTPQERRVLALVGQGMSNREIAAHLVLSEKTVRNHLTRLLAKLEVTSRTQAALIAVAAGIVPRSRIA